MLGLGLPEEVAVTKKALRKGWAVVAFSSTDRREHQCWDSSFPPEESKDTLPVLTPAGHSLQPGKLLYVLLPIASFGLTDIVLD